MSELKVATSRINYSGPDRMDISVKSSIGPGKVLAPTWDMVMSIKRGQITWQEYTDKYLLLMRYRWTKGHPGYQGNPFDQFMTIQRIVLCCYCNLPEGSCECHRYLAVDVLKLIAESRGIQFVYEGEV